jgi:hypothetical protein
MTTAIIFLLLLKVTIAAAQENVTTVPWWQVITGVIAIPTSLFGLYYLFVQIKKNLLESKKLNQELATIKVREEKQLEQTDLSTTVSVASEAKIKNSRIGSIRGIEKRSVMAQKVEQKVDVFHKGEMENSIAGDIVGVEYQVPPEKE